MKIFHFTQKQVLPVTASDAWSFFSNPENLKHITPKEMKFRIVSSSGPGVMHTGQIIEYRFHFFFWLRMKWVSKISEVRDEECFVDTQIKGPFRLWRHTHRFKSVKGGIEMSDEVDYALPWGWLGMIAHSLFVKKRVQTIFQFRNQVLASKFGTL